MIRPKLFGSILFGAGLVIIAVSVSIPAAIGVFLVVVGNTIM